jgi:RNA polymerase sigma-70 factor (ECF subfamily)
MTDAETPDARQIVDRRWSAWMASAQAGDRAAYETLLRECVPLIRRVARGQGVTGDRVDDVVQDVLLTVHRARQTYDPARSCVAWLRTIARRRAIDMLRRSGRHNAREIHAPLAYEAYAEPGAEADLGRERTDRVRQLGAAIASLGEGQREAVEHLAMRELSLSEAAEVTGKTKGALKVNFHRALKALRVRLDGQTLLDGEE